MSGDFAKYPNIARYFLERDSGNYDFYRCEGCRRVFTFDHERSVMSKISRDAEAVLSICKCGGCRYRPTMPVGLEWARPSVIDYTVRVALARKFAPWADARGLVRLVSRIDRLLKRET